MAFARLIPFLCLAVLWTTPGRAGALPRPFMPDGPVADAPAGFMQMCARDRALCMMGDTATVRSAPRDGSALPLLARAVNALVNRHVTRMTDLHSRGVGEYWDRPMSATPVGDCEDFAIEKRVRLMETGFPADRLFYAVAFVRGLGLHTVLIAHLDDGDYVLDSLTPHVLRWERSHYVWLRRQVPGAPLQWQRIDPTLRLAAAPAAKPAS